MSNPQPIQVYSEALAEIERRLTTLDNGTAVIPASEQNQLGPIAMLQDRIHNVHQRILKLVADGVIAMPDPVHSLRVQRPIQLLNARFELLTHGIDVAEEEAATEDDEPDLIVTLTEIDGNTYRYKIDKPLYDWKIEQTHTDDWHTLKYTGADTFEVTLTATPTDEWNAFRLIQEGAKQYRSVDIPFECFTTVGSQVTFSSPVIFLVIQQTTKESNEVVIEQVKGTKTCKLMAMTYWQIDGKKGEGSALIPLEDVSEDGHVRYKLTVPNDGNDQVLFHFAINHYADTEWWFPAIFQRENASFVFWMPSYNDVQPEAERITVSTGEQISVQLNGQISEELATELDGVKFRVAVKSMENTYTAESEWLPLTSENQVAITIDSRQVSAGSIGKLVLLTSKLAGASSEKKVLKAAAAPDTSSYPSDMRESTVIYFPFGATNTFELQPYELIPYVEDEEEGLVE